MIDLGVVFALWGSLFQDHKWRDEEWSGWHPAFKVIGLWTGYELEYLDILLVLFAIAAQCIAYQYVQVVSLFCLPTYCLIWPLLILHIYNPETRWGWCYLHSAALQYFWRRCNIILEPPIHINIWLYNTTNTIKFYISTAAINLFYLPALFCVINTNDKTHFIEACIPCDDITSWLIIEILLFYVLIVWQINIWCVNKSELPSQRDLRPVLRVYQGYTLNIRHFLRWNFFYREAFPWKFFDIMQLYGVFELCPYTRSWESKYYDVVVTKYYSDYNCQFLYATHADNYIWSFLKPVTQKGTYRSKTKCEAIYSMTK